MSEIAVLSAGDQFTSRVSRRMMPASNMRTKASVTARERLASRVKHSRCQSIEPPSDRSCCVMRPPYSVFHSQTRRTNSSRPRSRRETPCLASIFSTTACVAMPA
eukprot:Amastigsp_a343892_3.p3 type:complete len:105 gc:universal Amastigsp_a343892_3:551-237(-)